MACRLAHKLYLKTNCANKPRRGNLTIQSTKQMKKFLLSLLAVLTSTIAFADTWTLATEVNVGDVVVLAYTDGTVKKELKGIAMFGSNSVGESVDYTETVAAVQPLSVVEGSAKGSVAFKMANGSYLSWASGNTLTTSNEVSDASSWTISYANAKWTIQNVGTPDRKLQYNSGSPRFCCYTSTQKLVDLWKKDSGAAAAVAEPVITPATSTVFGDQTVTITCATEGAKIYYLKTVEFEEGSQNQKAYEEYTSPLTIHYDNGSLFGKTTKATISAYAVVPATDAAAEQTSETVEVTLTWATVYTSIAEANAAATETRTDAGIQADNWLVTYVNGQYTYLTDGVAGLLLFGNGLGLEQGQKVSGLIKGQLYSYNGLPEVASPNVDELEVMSEGNEVAPIVVASAALAADKAKWVNMFVRIEKAESIESYSVEEGARAANYDFDDDDVFTARNAFRIGFETEAGEMYNLEGFYAIYNDGGQLYPTAIEKFEANLDFEVSEPVEVGICTYAKDMAKNGTTNFGAQPIVGWTVLNASDNQAPPAGSDSRGALDQKAAGVFAYGSTAWLGGKGYNPPAAAPEGSTGKNCLGLCSVWGGENAVISYTQDIELEGGHYIVTIPVFNAAGTNALTENNIGIISPTGMKYMAETKQYPVGEWTTETITLDVADDDTYTISLGIVNGGGSGTAPHLFIDGVYIESVSEEDISRKYLEDVIAQAEKLLEEPYGQLFTKVESAHYDLDYSVEDAKGVLDSEAPTAYDLDEAARYLLIAMETYEGSDIVYPEDGQKYTIQQKSSKLYMTVNGGTKLSEEPMAFAFSEDADGGWTIRGDEEYVACKGANVWNMDQETEIGYRWHFEVLADGYYTISKEINHNHHIGSNEPGPGEKCFCDKGVNDNSMWIIEEYKGIPATVFTVSTARGAWMFDADNNRMHYNAAGLPEKLTDDYKFSLIEKDGHKFLYSLGAQKFVQPQKSLVEGISTPVVVTEGDGYSMMKAEKANLTINIGGQWTWDTWSSVDDGNKLSIQEVDEFDATDAIAMLDNTPIDQHKVYTITTRRGQWAANADGKSLGTILSNPEATDADKQFAFYYDGADIYIYSVGAKKFIKSDGSLFAGKTDPVDYRYLSDEYPYCFYFTGSNIYFNMQGNGKTYAMNTWNSPDDGNKQKFGIVDVDVYDEMKAVFEAQPIDVVYEVYWNDKMVASATVKHVPGDEIAIPAELDRGLCTLEPDITEIEADTKVVKLTATWNDLFKFSESFEDAVWYNMDIRSGWQVYKCESEPYYMKNDPTEEELASPEFQWAFAGDPYNIVVYNKSLSGSWSLAPVDLEGDMHCVGMREGEYTWDLFGNADGFVLREAKTLNNFINQSGGGRVDCPLSFWTGGRNDDGSTFRVVECNEALELAVDVDYYKGQNGLNYEIDFTEALEFLGIESLDEATIAGVDVTTDVEVENYTIFDGWRNANGDYEQWGDNAAVCVKFIEEPEQFAIYDMGNDNVPEVGETFVARFHIKTQGKTVVYNINVNFVEPPLKYLADYTEKGSFDVTIFAPEKGVAFDGEDSEEFSEAEVSDLIGVEWGDIFGKGFTDEVGETFATEYTNEPAPGFWCLEDGTADVEENGAFAVSLIPAEDWTSFNFRAWTKEAIEENLTTTFYLVNEETKEYVAYNITLSAKPAVNLVGEFDGMIKQILSHPQTGKQGEATGEQTVTIAEGEEEGTYDVTYSGFVMPITGAILPEFTIHGVEAEIAEDGTTAKYVLPAWAPQSITIDRGTGTVTYKIQFEGTKDGNDMPILKLTLDNSVIDEVWFGPDEEAIDEAIADGISTIKIAGTSNKIFDLSGRQLDKVQKSGIYIVNGKKVSIK